MPDLEIRDLTVEYASGGYVVRPVEHLDLDVEAGRLVLLLGASGCGKTTLLSVLATILTPFSGQVRFGGVEVTALRGAELTSYRRHTVGIVFQAFNLVQSLTALENVQMPLWASGERSAAARVRAETLLDQVGLTDRTDHRPGDLSGGQQQRVAIARALAHDPPLVLADEPTAHLDYIQVEGVIRLLQELVVAGRVVVVATHDERLLPLADQVVQMSPRQTEEVVTPQPRTLASGEVLFEQGDPGDLVYVVESGRIELLRDLADGGQEVLGHVGPGSYFGELAPLFGLRRSAGARAVAPTSVTGYSVSDFRARARRDWSTVAPAVTPPGRAGALGVEADDGG